MYILQRTASTKYLLCVSCIIADILLTFLLSSVFCIIADLLPAPIHGVDRIYSFLCDHCCSADGRSYHQKDSKKLALPAGLLWVSPRSKMITSEHCCHMTVKSVLLDVWTSVYHLQIIGTQCRERE